MTLRIVEVTTAAQAQAWLELPRRLYADDPVWVCPLDAELTKTFDPKRNPAFGHGEAARWLALDGDRVVGRIAAFIDRERAARFDRPLGAFGFFESEHNPAVAQGLFTVAHAWLRARGMAGAIGPANFGENDRFAGLLVEGFTHPAFGMNYNPVFYEHLLEGAGYRRYFDQVSMHLPITPIPPPRYQKVYEWMLERRPDVRYDYPTKATLDTFARHFQAIYNDAWRQHLHFTPITDAQAQHLANELRPIILPRMMVFAFVGDQPAGMLLSLPDLNQIFKPVRGRFPWWQQLLFLLRSQCEFAWYRERGILTRLRCVIVGVRPQFQKLGLDVGMVAFAHQQARHYGITEVELGWVGDWNPLSRALQAGSGAHPGKVHRTYRIHFDGSPITPMTSVAG